MKTRQGFISNSSSTSFLVGWDKPVETLDDVLKFIPNPLEAEFIYNLLREQVPTVVCSPETHNCSDCENKYLCITDGYASDELIEKYMSPYERDLQDEEEYQKWKIEYSNEYQADIEYSRKSLQPFVLKAAGKYAYVFTIWDAGMGAGLIESAMRDNPPFNNLPYIQWL